jgi:hypothetical protein
MKVIWLNDSLVLRAESAEEKSALVILFYAKVTHDDEEPMRGETEELEDAEGKLNIDQPIDAARVPESTHTSDQ